MGVKTLSNINYWHIFQILSTTYIESTNQYVYTFQWVKQPNLLLKQNKRKQRVPSGKQT